MKARPLDTHPIGFRESWLLDLIQEKSYDVGQKALAEQVGVSPQYMCDVLAGKRRISDNLSRKFGFARVTYFVRLEESER